MTDEELPREGRRRRPDDIHHRCICGGLVTRAFGCSHFGSPMYGNHYRHAVCCAYRTRTGHTPVGPLLTGAAARRALDRAGV